MKKLYLLLILTILTGITQSHAFDTLHNYNHHNQEEQSSGWYDTIKSFFGQKVPETKNRDIIIINQDRSISFNGHKLKLMAPVDNWVKVIGKPSRIDQYGGYSWDNNGLSISTKENNVKSIEVQFLDHYEIFPMDKELGKKEGEGGILAKHFQGVIKIEDGYMAREVTRKEFKRSKIWRKFKERAFPNSYSSTYEDEKAIQFNVITFTADGKSKRFSIYTSL